MNASIFRSESVTSRKNHSDPRRTNIFAARSRGSRSADLGTWMKKTEAVSRLSAGLFLFR
jgi:hypothetical protein